jgi:cytochrome b involved in lipid metabolism
MSTKYYHPSEIALHNSPSDCWLSWLGSVYDVSNLTKSREMVNPILAMAGKDISHWFDVKTGDVSKFDNN